MDAGKRRTTRGGKSGCRTTSRRNSPALGNCELGHRGLAGNEAGKNGSGKSAMKKSESVMTKEAVLTWPNVGSRDSLLQDAARILQHEFAAAWRACGAFEWIALGYMGLSSGLIAICARNVAHPLRLVATQAFASF